jgi:hypothetical protein
MKCNLMSCTAQGNKESKASKKVRDKGKQTTS